MSRLAGKVALVTGAGSGIGRAVAERFAAEGAKVVIADIAEDRGRAVAEAIGAAAAFIRCDHTASDQNARAVEFAVERFGGLDIVHNNAGGPFTGPFEDVDDETLERVLRVNLFGVMQMARAALPALRDSARRNPAGAALLFTSSLQGLKAKPNFSLYTVAKHGIVGLVRSLALELAPQNIRVNALCPTVIETPMLQAFLPGMAADREEALQRFRATIPLARMPEPEDVASAALFLVSDEARMITGVALPVDGGQMAM
ncbi:MAG TPA: SDR family oxidoreductase [Aliidongia sp.]|uniref:SDR family NAD(P)-dependent oxidoreductase n=1 Tax=Aliidongia sp. TaxID=1914230 RepID=UPI002DDD2C57|nr:SDR family oxidoreductase [Aliidongia sp.]HEV2677382.1 SDR family oxidoreductase [Aliidongia sp.]